MIRTDTRFNGIVDLLIDDDKNRILPVTINKGYGDIRVPNITRGNHIAKVIFNKTDIFKQSEYYTNFKTELTNPNIIITVNDIRVGDDAFVEIRTDSRFSGWVTVKLNSNPNEDKIKIKNGYGNITYDRLEVNNYTVTIFFEETEVFNQSIKTSSFSVVDKLINPNLNISVKNITYGEDELIEINMDKRFNGSIDVIVDGDERIYVMNIVSGYGHILISKLNVGQHTVKAIFKEIGIFNKSEETEIFNVNLHDSNLSIIVEDFAADMVLLQ